jgi:hypothetical protein
MSEAERSLALRAKTRFLWAISTYVLGEFLDEVLAVNLGVFWFRPIKIGTMVAMLMTLRYIWIPFHARGAARWLLVFWGAYNFWWGISIFWNPGFGTLLNQSNILSRHIQEYLLTCGLAGAMIRAGGFNSIGPFFLLYPIMAHLDLAAGIGDYIAGHRVLRSGVVESSAVYGIGMHGFHHERLNLAELLILGGAFLLGSRPRGLFLKIARLPIMLATPFILFLLDSYSGFLGYLLFMLICGFRIMGWWGRSIMLIMAVVFVTFIPRLVSTFVPLAVQKESQQRLEQRLEGQNSSSWRYLATDYLIKAVKEDPQLFGNGYLATQDVLYNVLGTASSPHTIASIPFEQGIIGVILFLAFGMSWAYHAGRFILREPAAELVSRPIYLCLVAMLCCALMRVLFYYQVRNINYYLLTTAFLAVAYLGYGTPAGNGSDRQPLPLLPNGGAG